MANPLWDGDGVQGVGQPRDRMGRWIGLPGPSLTSAIKGIKSAAKKFEVHEKHRDGSTSVKSFRTKREANAHIESKINEDVTLHLRAKRDNQNLKRRKKIAEARRQSAESKAKQEARDQKVVADAAAGRRLSPVPKTGRQERKPARVATKVTVSETERMKSPGTPTMDQANKAIAHAKNTMPDHEAKYAGMITRLLRNRGVTQDPARRGDIHEKYGITPKRQAEIEREMYDHMFPPKAQKAKAAVPKARTTKQGAAMEKNGALTGSIMPLKEGNRNSYIYVDKNGNHVVTDRQGKTRVATPQEKSFFEKARKYRREQRNLLEAHLDSEAAKKEGKILAAKRWAKKEGLDPEDSHWWAFFWNDPSLLKNQDDSTDVPIQVGLSPKQDHEKMDPATLESLLAMPDISAHKMRGHRPGSRKSQKGDDDFVEAGASSRQDSPEWQSGNAGRLAQQQSRIRRAYQNYLNKHPGSKMTLEQFTNDYYNSKMRIPGGARVKKISKRALNPFWDGDGLQGVGQPRGYHGRWVKLPGASALKRIGVFEHTDGSFGVYADNDKLLSSHKTARSAELKAARLLEKDRGQQVSSRSRSSNPWDGIKFKPLQGRPHRPTGPDGRPIARKNYSPEEAAYRRNHGSTKISNLRLKAIKQNRSIATQQERDLILSAVAQKHIDGDDPIKIRTARGVTTSQPRYRVLSDIAREMANDAHKVSGRRGKGGQVVRRDNDAKRERENAKKLSNNRSKWESKARRQWLLDNFGNGTHATCIICGNKSRPVTIHNVSPERIKPGGHRQSYGGVYEEGNVAPAHVTCNLAGNTSAQHDPEAYYRENLRMLMKIWGRTKNPAILQVIKKHRAMLKRLESEQ